jgi:hypothetical protein
MAPEPSPHETKSVRLEVVRDTQQRPRGRPTVLTLRRFIQICRVIERGTCTSMACKVYQVTYSHFRFRVSRSPRLEQRLKQAEDVRFALRHDFALEAILQAGKKSWMAYAWYLERVLPERYSLKTVHRDDGDTGGQPIGDAIPAERLAEYGKLMLEMAQENAGKADELPIVAEAAS